MERGEGARTGGAEVVGRNNSISIIPTLSNTDEILDPNYVNRNIISSNFAKVAKFNN